MFALVYLFISTKLLNKKVAIIINGNNKIRRIFKIRKNRLIKNILKLIKFVFSISALALKPRLHQRNMRAAQHVACCRQQNCCADEQHVAGSKQLVARNILLVRATCCRAHIALV